MLVQLVLLVVMQTALALDDRTYYDVDDFEVMGHHFEKFLKDYHRQYSGDVKAMKFNIFIENLKEINEMNNKHPGATFGINQFADKSREERKSLLGFSVGDADNPNGDCVVLKATSDKSSPTDWDWRAFDVVSPVKDQKDCFGCWAFSTTGLLESRILQKKKDLLVSEQQLLDCDKQSSGCHGGLMTLGLTSVMKDGGIESETDYPFIDADKQCNFDKSKVVAKVANCTAYSLENEDALQDLLYKQGPLAIGVQASHWGTYTTGILQGEQCKFSGLDHGVLLVGYGVENGVDFWVIKNSWNEQWGESGYIRVKKGVNCCGIGAGEPFATVWENANQRQNVLSNS